MPRRNLLLLFAIFLIALVCYQRVQRNTYGRVLSNAMSVIEDCSLEPVKAPELFEAAMEGIVGQLDDNSTYIPPADLQDFHQAIDQQFGGVGIEVGLDPKTKQLVVLCPLIGSPACLAGIRAGDRILRIDDAGTQGMSLGDAVGLLRGKPGSDVALTVLHENEQSPVEIKIIRATIQMDTVLGDTRNADGSWNYLLEGHDRIGYVRIVSFADQTVDELERAIQWLKEHDMRGLVLDLRNDPGGLLTSAIDVCDQFIQSGVIVTVRRRDGRVVRPPYEASGKGTWTDFPMAILVDGLTASAAEIVAACLQDHHRAVIIGQRTYGKGTVQELLDLEDGWAGALKLTTASYWRPSGKNIHRLHGAKETDEWGVRPDEGFEVVIPSEQLNKLRQWRFDRDYFKPNGFSKKPAEMIADPQLNRAVEYVEKEDSKDGKEPPQNPQ